MLAPLISVITPCYNAEAYIQEAIRSVFQQTYSNIELIVVDDGSTDQSKQILRQCQDQFDKLIILEQQNLGPFPARNLALKHAQGEFVAFLDADDYWSIDCLQKLYEALISKNADISYCGWQNVVENSENGPLYVPPAYATGAIHENFLTSCPWPIHAALTRKSIIDKVKGFSTRCFSAMDYDFWLRISAVSENMVLVPEVLAFYRWHNHGQISSVKYRQILDSWRVRKDFISQNPQLVANIPNAKLNNLVDGYVIRQAYTAFWKNDFVSAQHLFRAIWKNGIWRFKDLIHIAASFLSESAFVYLVKLKNRE